MYAINTMLTLIGSWFQRSASPIFASRSQSTLPDAAETTGASCGAGWRIWAATRGAEDDEDATAAVISARWRTTIVGFTAMRLTVAVRLEPTRAKSTGLYRVSRHVDVDADVDADMAEEVVEAATLRCSRR